MALKADLDLPERPFTLKSYILLLLSAIWPVSFIWPTISIYSWAFCSSPCSILFMCPDSSGKLIRPVHICQPASFFLATALKCLNTKIYLHKISLFLLLRLQCNLQEQFKVFISKKGVVVGWKTGELLWKTYWITAHTDGQVKQHTKKKKYPVFPDKS